LADETILRFGADIRKQRVVISFVTKRRTARWNYDRRELKMRTISFILAFAFILAGPSMAGSSDSSLPGIGTFSYGASQTVIAAN